MRDEQGAVLCGRCDTRQVLPRVAPGFHARCHRCESPLCRGGFRSLDVPLGLTLSALVCWALANALPFITLEYHGLVQTDFLFSGSVALWRAEQRFVSLLVGFAGIVAPGGQLLVAVYVLTKLRRGARLGACGRAVPALALLRTWSMPGVYLIGVLVAAVKLVDLASLSPGPGLFAWVALVLLWTSASVALDTDSLEQRFG